MISHCVSMFLGAVLVRAQQQQPVLPGYGSEHSTCQDACPGGEMDTATPCFKGDKNSGMWKWMYHVVWPHCQKPVLDSFSAVAKAWLSQAVAKICGFFSISFCLPLHVKLAWPPTLCISCMCNGKSASETQRLLHTWSGAPAESLSSGWDRVPAASHWLLSDRWHFRPVFYV